MQVDILTLTTLLQPLFRRFTPILPHYTLEAKTISKAGTAGYLGTLGDRAMLEKAIICPGPEDASENSGNYSAYQLLKCLVPGSLGINN